MKIIVSLKINPFIKITFSNAVIVTNMSNKDINIIDERSEEVLAIYTSKFIDSILITH